MGRGSKFEGCAAVRADDPPRVFSQVDEVFSPFGNDDPQRVVEEAGARQEPPKGPGDALGAPELPGRDREAAATRERVPRIVPHRVQRSEELRLRRRLPLVRSEEEHQQAAVVSLVERRSNPTQALSYSVVAAR